MLIFIGCAPTEINLDSKLESSDEAIADTGPEAENPSAPPQNPAAPPSPVTSAPDLKFCSNLDFKGVDFPSSMSPAERRAFSVALTISGSFEGPNGWVNITNDFDGMGLSAGLLNQTLGTGSLQPVLLQARARDPRAFDVLSRDRRASLNGMLDRWQAARKFKVTSATAFSQELNAEAGFDESSRLDEDFIATDGGPGDFYKVSVAATVASAEQPSVEWARENLYQAAPKQSQFKAEWKRELQLLLATPAVRTEQVLAALQLHARAKQYAQRLGRNDLRHYLTMFDIAVQNGGLKSDEFARIESWTKTRRWSDVDRLKQLVEVRMERVRVQYKEDVRRRKFSIIIGQGTVHGRLRRHEQEACIRLAEVAF
jgi:hypothetical protein